MSIKQYRKIKSLRRRVKDLEDLLRIKMDRYYGKHLYKENRLLKKRIEELEKVIASSKVQEKP